MFGPRFYRVKFYLYFFFGTIDKLLYDIYLEFLYCISYFCFPLPHLPLPLPAPRRFLILRTPSSMAACPTQKYHRTVVFLLSVLRLSLNQFFGTNLNNSKDYDALIGMVQINGINIHLRGPLCLSMKISG